MGLGLYYFEAARNELVPFFRVTVLGRIIFALGIIAFVVLDLLEPLVLVFSLADVLGALWTDLAIRRSTAGSGHEPM